MVVLAAGPRGKIPDLERSGLLAGMRFRGGDRREFGRSAFAGAETRISQRSPRQDRREMGLRALVVAETRISERSCRRSACRLWLAGRVGVIAARPRGETDLVRSDLLAGRVGGRDRREICRSALSGAETRFSE
ncbi:hypothetical protein ACQPZQ_02985 [Pseudonocardia sp. CA-142604]|uniref:hypothetical protein n=1 Tax=Pseudonocardia sp. CA-142604 TaxID=3240024 RepID=UPI003D92235E